MEESRLGGYASEVSDSAAMLAAPRSKLVLRPPVVRLPTRGHTSRPKESVRSVSANVELQLVLTSYEHWPMNDLGADQLRRCVQAHTRNVTADVRLVRL